MKKYGYIRVSTKDQNPKRQYAAFQKFDIPEKQIYIDQMSGKDFARSAYQKMLSRLKKGDLLIVKSIDRLGRNYGEILEQWRIITKEKGANIQVIDMPLLNTSACPSDLTRVFVADLVLQILAYVAETERAFIRQRQAEGIAVAKVNGVKFGCRKIKITEEFERYYELWTAGKISSRKAAQMLHISHSTFYRRCKEKRENL